MLDKEYAKNSGNSLTKTRNLTGEELSEFTYNILNEAKDAKYNNINDSRDKDLLAIHNLKESKLKDSVELGGLVMPSIAVTKDTMPHEQFGEYSAVFDKSSIDPQIDDRNKVYSRDAWTPTYPYVDYKANEEVQHKIRDLYYQLKDKIGFEEARPLYTYTTDLEGELNSEKGEANLIKYVKVPIALQSKVLNLMIPFQVETNNAFRTMASMAKNPRSWMSLLTILLVDWLFNELSENLYGDRILFDPIDVIYDSITSGNDAKDTGLRPGGELLSAIPCGSYFPMLFGLSEDDTEKYFGESDPSRYGTGNMGLSVIGDTAKNIADGKYLDAASDLIANFALPGGGKQAQRTIEALQVNGMLPQYQNGQLVNEPIHYTGSGKVGFVNNPEAIMDNPSNFIDFAKQVLFGKWAGKNAQEYINSNFNGLGSDKQNDMFKELAQSLSPIDAYNAVKGINQAKEDSISSSENDTPNDELLSDFDSKKEELSGKRDSKTKFIDYITSSDYTSEQKNYIFDEYYGDSNLATFINDFAESKNLDDETIYNMKSLTSTAEGVKGSNGKSIKNSKSLKVRKELEQLGVYDDFVQYIYKNDLDPSTFGLNDSVMEMSNADFNYNYQNIYGEAYTSKSNEQLMQEAYAATFGKTSPSLKKQQKALQKAYDEEMKKRENFKKDLAKIANGTSTKSNYKNVNSILQSALKNTKSKSIKTSNSDFVDELIKKYKEDHPYDNLFS